MGQEPDEIIDRVANLPAVRWLHLRGIAVTDEHLYQIRRLKRLEWLDLSFTSITDEGTHAIANFPNVQSFSNRQNNGVRRNTRSHVFKYLLVFINDNHVEMFLEMPRHDGDLLHSDRSCFAFDDATLYRDESGHWSTDRKRVHDRQ
jgi:hypothetical protein